MTDCPFAAVVGESVYPCRSDEGGRHHFAAHWPACPAPFCRLPAQHREGLHDIPGGRAEVVNTAARGCGRCHRVLVDDDGDGWYYQAPFTDPGFPGLTFMDRVRECDGRSHEVISRLELLALERNSHA